MYTHSLPPHQWQIMVNSVRVRPIKYYRGTQDNWKLQRWGMRVGEGGVGYRNPAEAVVEFFSHACSKYHTISPFLRLLFVNSRWTNYNLICTRSTQSRFFCICFCRMNYTVQSWIIHFNTTTDFKPIKSRNSLSDLPPITVKNVSFLTAHTPHHANLMAATSCHMFGPQLLVPSSLSIVASPIKQRQP